MRGCKRLCEPQPRPDDDARKSLDILGIWDAGDDDYIISPRGWLLGTTFCRGFLSSVIADGATGKTALRISQLVSPAIGHSLTGEHVFQRCRVLIVSLEDSKDELRRRVYAILKHHEISPAEVGGWLFLAAPKGLKLAEMRDGSPEAGVLTKLLRDVISVLRLDIISLDPFIKSHAMSENDNNAIDYVCTLLVEIATEYNCAVDFPHHARKGPAVPGDADRGRGASSARDAARLVYTLTTMTAEEAKLFTVSEAERRSLIRLDSGKVNIAPPSRDAQWFRVIGVPLGNATDLYPNGDEVQTVIPWPPPDLWEGLSSQLLNRILDQIEAGLPNGSRYSAAPNAKDRAAWRVVAEHAPDKQERRAREIINIWTRTGLLYDEDYDDPTVRRTVKGLRVNATKRPS
jgi:hypothetical protein